VQDGVAQVLNEAESKALLARCGIPFPASRVVGDAAEAAAAAEELGYPVVAKALGVAHKTEVGGVVLNLRSADEVSAAVAKMSKLSGAYLIEKMVDGAVAELIVGVARDEDFGPYLLIGGGGALVEILKDSASLLLPTTRERVLDSLLRLKCAPLLKGFRGAPAADVDAAVDVILAVAGLVEKNPSSIVELDINPLMVRADGRGAVAADALISLNPESTIEA
jgi:acetyl-CoA synthetase